MKRVLLNILLIIAILFFWYPNIANFVNNSIHDVTISEYEEVSKSVDADTILKKAYKWNNNHSIGKYKNILNIKHGMMGYIEIQKLNIRLPIYHSDNNKSLEKGVGHNKDSSLPIGGKNTHCILAGHSGMTNEKMFDDLGKLKNGDVFLIYVLDRVFAYKVNRKIVTIPSKVSNYVRVEEDKDLCTLITCTPYGVNTHRLLVRGERINYKKDINTKAFKREDNTIIYVLLSLFIMLTLFNLLWNKLFKGRKDEAKKDS